MFKLLDTLEKVSAIAGVVVCGLAGIIRISGTYYLMGIQTMTIFTAGIALMVLATLLKLHLNDMK